MKKPALYLMFMTVVVDLLAVFLGLVVAYKIRGGGGDIYFWPYHKYLVFSLEILPIWLILFINQGLYNLIRPLKSWGILTRMVFAILMGWGAVLIILYISRSPAAQVFPRLLILYGIIWTLIVVLIGRLFLALIRWAFFKDANLIETVIVSHKDVNEFVGQLRNPIHSRRVVAVLDHDYIEMLNHIKADKRFEEIIVADPKISEGQTLEILDWAENHYCSFAQVPSLLSVRSTNVEVGTLAGQPITFFKRTPLEGWRRIYKRLLDIIVVLPIMIVLSPLYLLLFIIVPFTTGGGIIFKQKRIGQDGRTLYVHKFMSMYANHQKTISSHDWSADEKNDPRITPFGRFIRKTNLDELPQLWDVLTGAMSLVGPRPEQPQYVEKFAQEIPNYLKRHYVKSGLTGWAQINGLRGDTSIDERVKYDLYYIENWSIWFDIRIIISTFVYVLRQI